MHTEQNIPHFPQDYPDTATYKEVMLAHGDALQRKHDAKPRAKRVNHTKLKIASPHYVDWKVLVEESGGSVKSDVFVCRSYQHIETLKYLNTNASSSRRSYSKKEKTTQWQVKQPSQTVATTKDSSSSLPTYRLPRELSDLEGSLIRVSVRMYKKRVPAELSLLYRATHEDYKRWMRDPKAFELKEDHKMKRLTAFDGDDDSDTEMRTGNDKESESGQCTNDVSPSRQLIGRVTSGMFSLIRGQGSGVGFVTAASYYAISRDATSSQRKEQGFALLRNPTSFFYHPVIVTPYA
eukprot:GFYU01040300.1.p1 GENE.GFYU01040300.1~~GFYU01040300.1.p1  ORF type:complete len:304 (-),score=86.83 GFYU01040300.1:66-944(-)